MNKHLVPASKHSHLITYCSGYTAGYISSNKFQDRHVKTDNQKPALYSDERVHFICRKLSFTIGPKTSPTERGRPTWVNSPV